MQSPLSTSNIFSTEKLIGFLQNDKARLPLLALFLPLFLFVSLGFGQIGPAHHHHSECWSFQNSPSLFHDFSSLNNQSAHGPLSDRHAFVNDNEEFENEDFFVDPSRQSDLNILFSLGDFIHQVVCFSNTSFQRHPLFQGNLSEQFSNKLYILIRVFRI